jgi:hypothetical protein
VGATEEARAAGKRGVTMRGNLNFRLAAGGENWISRQKIFMKDTFRIVQYDFCSGSGNYKKTKENPKFTKSKFFEKKNLIFCAFIHVRTQKKN